MANYGQIAEIAGIPRGARQVGYALRHAPKDWSCPGTASSVVGQERLRPEQPRVRTQRERLAEEGVVMLNGKVDMKKYRWEPDLDELLWKPTSTWDEE